jgi:hypothetical protein
MVRLSIALVLAVALTLAGAAVDFDALLNSAPGKFVVCGVAVALGLVWLRAIMLLVRADRHRDGLIFPPFFYGAFYGARSRWVRDPHPLRGTHVGEIETEGLAIMAKDMGIECWGFPGSV